MIVDLIMANIVLTLLIAVPVAIVLTGLVWGTGYVFYLFMKDMISHVHVFHHKSL
jgi:hypothetical protein